jgi:hypothetical protein
MYKIPLDKYTVTCYTVSMATKQKERPNENPSWQRILAKSDSREKDEMKIVYREFGPGGVFSGKIVANWCDKCGRWRMHYVPKANLISTPGFTPEETFPCTKCDSALQLVTDENHTVLSNI